LFVYNHRNLPKTCDLPQSFNVEKVFPIPNKLLNVALAHQTRCEWFAGWDSLTKIKQNIKEASGYPIKPSLPIRLNTIDHIDIVIPKFFVERR